MDSQTFFETLDDLFAKNQIKEAGEYLEQSLLSVREAKDISLELSVLNEMMGYYRSTNQKEKGLKSVEEGLTLIRENGLMEHPAVATMWINMGTTLCHFNRVDEAEICYQNAEIFLKDIPTGALTMASLYNNTSAVFVKTKRFKEARDRYKKALDTLDTINNEQELWEDLLFNRIVTWLNILVLNQVEIRETDEGNELYIKELTEDSENIIKQIKEVLGNETFQETSSFAYALKKCMK